MEAAALGLRVEGVKGIDDASKSLDRLSGSAESAEKASGGLSTESRKTTKSLADVSRESGKASGGVDSLARAARRATGVLATFLGARQIVNYADTWTNLTSRVELSIAAHEDAADVMSRLADISRQTFSTLESTAEAFAQNSVTLRALGKSTQEQLNYTEALNNAIAVSGSEGAQAQIVQDNLSRAMAEGTLRSQELNTVLNYGSRVAELLAEELGVNVTQLRALAAEGEITGSVIFNALTGNMERLADESAGMGSTVRGAMRVLNNAVLETIGTLNQQYEAGARASSVILALADAVRDTDFSPLVTAATALASVIGARLAASVYASGAAFAAAQVQAIRYQAALASMAGVSTTAAIRLTALSAAARGASSAMAFLGGPVGVAVIAAGSLYYFRDEIWKSAEATKGLKEELEGAAGAMDSFTRAELENRRANLSDRLEDKRIEATRLTKELERKRLSNVMYQGRPGANPRHESVISRELQQAEADLILLEGAIGEVDSNLDRLSDTQTTTTSTTAQLAREARKLAEAWHEVRDSASSSLDRLMERLGLISEGTNQFRNDMDLIQKAFTLGLIDEAQADAIVNAMNDPEQWEKAGEDAGDAFINPWQSTADSVAQSLQDAIASGDWDKIGDSIGNALAASIAGIVNKTITDSLAKDLTANSSALAQIGGAFAGPIAGAVAGGAIQLAISELSDFFSGSDWDPTEARQAAQGTGTVLGSIDAKSESISKAVDISASASRELVGINRDMLRALQALQIGIAGASGMVARSYGGLSMPGEFNRSFSGSDFDLTSGIMPIFDETLGLAFDFFDEMGSIFSFGMFDLGDALGSVFGGSRKVKDLGIEFFGATLDEMIRGWRDSDRRYTAQAYASIEEDGGWFSSDKRWDEYQRLGTDAENQISLVFMGIRDSVTAGAEALGMADGEINRALSRFRVESQKISLEDLSAEEQTAELEAVFSSIFDQAAAAVVPYLDDFQKAGEGLGETLARVATQVQVTQEAVNMLGLRFSDLSGAALIEASDRLIELNGGLDQFISNMQNFIGNFATESQQFEINANALAKGMGDLPLPETRDGFWALMQAQDAATQAGAENIATLLRLQGTADAYYSAVEKAQEGYYQTEIQGQQQRLSEAQRANRAVQSAMDSMLFQSSAVQEASRQSALRTLDQIARAGRVDNLGQLQGALDAATQLDTGRFGSFADYAREYAKTAGVVGRVGDVTQQAESREARMLRNLESQLEAVKGLRKDLEISQLEIVKQTKKTARILDRISLGENEALA